MLGVFIQPALFLATSWC